MKHSLTALLLTLALFCCLLTGCGPTPDVPGGSEGRIDSVARFHIIQCVCR